MSLERMLGKAMAEEMKRQGVVCIDKERYESLLEAEAFLKANQHIWNKHPEEEKCLYVDYPGLPKCEGDGT